MSQKSLSRRCLSQAASVYQIPTRPSDPSDPRFPHSPLTGWSSVRSHLHHSLGRQAYNVGKSDDAVEHFLQLLVGAGDGAAVGDDWLDDFALAWEHLGPDEAGRVMDERGLVFPVTVFAASDTQIQVLARDGIAVEDAADPAWAGLAAELLPAVATLRKGATAAVKTLEAVVGETFFLKVVAQNPLDAPLAIGGLRVETDAEAGLVEIDAPQEIELLPRQALTVSE